MVEELPSQEQVPQKRKRGRPRKEVRRVYANSAEKQAAYRERKFEREHSVGAEDWMDSWTQRFPAEAAEIEQYVRDIRRRVADELGVPTTSAEETIDRVAYVSYGFAKAATVGKDAYIWLREVHEPNGIIVCGRCFPEVIGEDLVRDTYCYDLKKSVTYKALYDSLLQTLDERFGESTDPVEQQNASVVRQELSGKYIYQPDPAPAPSMPTVFADGREMTLEEYERSRSEALARMGFKSLREYIEATK